MAQRTHARIEATLNLEGYTGEVLIESITGIEEVSRAFEYTIDLQADELDLDELRATPACVILDGPHGGRVIHGIVTEIEVLGIETKRDVELCSYRLVLRPQMHLLSLRHGYRIFQNLSVVDIVTEIFKSAKIPDNDYKFLVGTYPKREYCVQYDESEWSFVCRLLEEEGIFFRFEHTESGHMMRLSDQSINAPLMDPGYLPFEQVGGLEDRLCARELEVSARACVHSVTLADCHPLRPSTPLTAKESTPSAFERDHYEFPSRCVDASKQKLLARIRIDEEAGRAVATHVRSNALGAMAGKRLTLDGHPTSHDGKFFVRAVRTEITLRALPDGAQAGKQDSERQAVCNIDLELQPLSMPFRPERRTPRPRIAGLQTARITGPGQQEVSFDDHGRITLQFHWDREGKLDDKSSCVMRVVQGHTTGSMAMPRVGWEVLVDFIDGDPDQPACLGRLYNPFFPPPVELPASKTMSIMRSASVGGAGFNQLRFDDQAGAEMFEMIAQYDMNTNVGNNHELQVEKAAAHSVTKNRKSSIGANETRSFEANVSDTVAKDHKLDVGVNRTIKVNGNATHDTTGNFDRTVGASESIQVGSISAAVISLLTSAAIEGATSAAAAAAERLGAKALGPLMPALNAARQSLGGAVKLAGPAAGLIGRGDASGIGLASSMGALSKVHASIDVSMATSMAVAAASAKLAPKIAAAAGGGGGGGGGGGAASPSTGGSGSATTNITGNVSETVGGLVAISSAQGISRGIGGNAIENIGAARIEAIRGGRVENIGAAKAETVGVYKVQSKTGIAINAGAAAKIDISGALTQNIGGNHTLTGKEGASIKSKKLTLKAKTGVTLECGMAKVTIDSGGISFSGLQKITIDGNEITMAPVDIGPG